MDKTAETQECEILKLQLNADNEIEKSRHDLEGCKAFRHFYYDNICALCQEKLSEFVFYFLLFIDIYQPNLRCSPILLPAQNVPPHGGPFGSVSGHISSYPEGEWHFGWLHALLSEDS